jgi:hypothetical protein
MLALRLMWCRGQGALHLKLAGGMKVFGTVLHFNLQ